MKETISVHRLSWAATATAVTFLMTVLPKIPIPLGYAHLGDAVIFLIALLLPRRDAAMAAAIGSALADLLGGFPIWILPTLLIKAGMVFLVAPFVGRSFFAILFGFLLSSLWMAAGYTAAGAVLYGDLSLGLLQTPGLLAEGAVNTAAAAAFLLVLKKSRKR